MFFLAQYFRKKLKTLNTKHKMQKYRTLPYFSVYYSVFYVFHYFLILACPG
jgi:hypothetical protein